MNNPDHISESLETIFLIKILKFFDADPRSGMEKVGSGIRDKHPDPQYCLVQGLRQNEFLLIKWNSV